VYKPRPQLSQNFLHSQQLVKKLIGKSSIGKKDIVLEIGPGKGIITRELAKICGQLIAVEIDPRLVKHLREIIPENVVLFQQDGLNFPLPSTPYKVFSNPPFAIQGKLFRKFIKADNPPEDCFLVVRERSARRWAGVNKNSQFSVLHRPWFEFSIVHEFKPADFKPSTKVKAVFLRFQKRKEALISVVQKGEYFKFVKQGFGGGRRINQNLSDYFSNQKLNQITQRLGIPFDAKPTEVSLKDWIDLFNHT